MAEYKYFGRYYHLKISDKYGMTLLDAETYRNAPALDIRFNVNFARGQICRDGTISVLGLQHSTITEILYLAAEARGKAMSEQVRCTLDAGYFSEAGWMNIIDGYIWTATVTSPPTMWLNMSIAEYGVDGGATPQSCKVTVCPNISEESVQKVGEKVAEIYSEVEGVKIKFEDKTQDQLCSQKSWKSLDNIGSKTLKSIVEQMSNSLHDSITFGLKRNSSRGNPDGALVIGAYDKDPAKAWSKRPIIVDKDNGLLSVSGISVTNATVSTFITENAADLMYLNLISEINPHANGTYIITKIGHIGHYEGNEWYTQYTCSGKKGADGKEVK